jgi:uncharacterized glyoxalase superfamily protein PhnB
VSGNDIQRLITIIVYSDIGKASEFLSDVFGLEVRSVIRNGEGQAVHAELNIGGSEIWLHAEQGDYKLGSPQTIGGATANYAVMVDDVDAHYERALANGAQIHHEPVDQAYGYREYSAHDPEGHLWSFMKPLK